VAVTNFDTVNGQVLAETSGGVTKNYVVDALGSVTGVSNAGSLSGAARYSPYGRTITGSSGAVGGWVWSWGYYPTSRAFASHYVRARHFDSGAGAWPTSDPVFAQVDLNTYAYAFCSPTTVIDPSGLSPKVSFSLDTKKAGSCGSYLFSGDWAVGSTDPGWIVQHVKTAYDIYYCNTRPPDSQRKPPVVDCPLNQTGKGGPYTQWYEAWFWDGKQALDGYFKPGFDKWSDHDQKCSSHSSITVTAEAKFFKTGDRGWAKKNGLVLGGVSCAADLYANYKFAAKTWNSVSDFLSRHLTSKWSCCCPPAGTTNRDCNCPPGDCNPTNPKYSDHWVEK